MNRLIPIAGLAALIAGRANAQSIVGRSETTFSISETVAKATCKRPERAQDPTVDSRQRATRDRDVSSPQNCVIATKHGHEAVPTSFLNPPWQDANSPREVLFESGGPTPIPPMRRFGRAATPEREAAVHGDA